MAQDQVTAGDSVAQIASLGQPLGPLVHSCAATNTSTTHVSRRVLPGPGLFAQALRSHVLIKLAG
mgnify:CR=1 FL=1